MCPLCHSWGVHFKGGWYRTEPKKTKAVEEWPVHENRKQLQPFLGFVSFYRQFIDYSCITSLTTYLHQQNLQIDS